MDKIDLPQDLQPLISSPRPLYKDGRLDLPETSEGLYIFWWANGWDDSETSRDLRERGAKEAKFAGPRNLEAHCTGFHAPGRKPLLETEHLALFVGKSMKMSQRLKQHLLPSTTSERYRMSTGGKPVALAIYGDDAPNFVYKRTTSCQFRAGMEYLFRDNYFNPEVNALGRIKKHVLISTLTVSQEQGGFKHRFYSEDLLIGLLEPWFNLDGER